MFADFTAFGFTTFCLMAMFAWVIFARFSATVDKGVPLIVWGLAVVYLRSFEGSFPPLLVYVGAVCALFLRFEYMGGWVIKTIRLVESGTMGLLLLRCFVMLRN